ncbi:MAG: YfcE family phosphodiesterase [Planctomycetaceae bacterium]|nr:YfcE family phosphodiesterase [Planctomycetaceae bacterium]
MKILVIADVHSNWTALSSIEEAEQGFDACLFVGDLVDYGTDPVPCINWARQHVTAGVRGNHDHAVAQRVPARGGEGFRRLAAATRPLHWDLIDGRRLKYLAQLPITQSVEVGGQRFYMVHATPRDPMDEYLLDDVAAWSERLQGVDADIVCVGHTHVPLCLDVGGKQLVNPGSVGQPRDGDPRAAYAVIEDGVVSLRRAAYDIDAALQQMRSVGVPDWVVELNSQVLRSGGNVTRDQIGRFR